MALQKKKLHKDVAKKMAEFSGERYKSKKAGGDTKGNSKYQPFAYVRMDPKQLNKRSRQTSHLKYGSILQKTGQTKSSSRGIKKPYAQRKAIKKHAQLAKLGKK